MTDGPLIQTPGELLAAARGRAGLGLDQVAERTKIPPAMLEAIERDEYHKISGQLYVRSFLRSYAVEVGLDPDQVLELHGRFSGEGLSVPSGGGRAQVWEEEEVVVQRVGLPWKKIMVAAAVLAAVLAVVVILVAVSGRRDDGVRVTAEPASIPAATGPAAGEGIISGDDQASSGTEDGGAGSAGPGAEAVGVPADQKEAPASLPAAAAIVPQTGAGLLPAVSGTENVRFAGSGNPALVLRVLSGNPVGIEVRADGQREFSTAVWPAAAAEVPPLPAEGIVLGRVYRSGDGFVVYWGASDHFSLRLGATEGVQVHLDGMRYPLAGLSPGQEVILDRHSVGR